MAVCPSWLSRVFLRKHVMAESRCSLITIVRIVFSLHEQFVYHLCPHLCSLTPFSTRIPAHSYILTRALEHLLQTIKQLAGKLRDTTAAPHSTVWWSIPYKVTRQSPAPILHKDNLIKIVVWVEVWHMVESHALSPWLSRLLCQVKWSDVPSATTNNTIAILRFAFA